MQCRYLVPAVLLFIYTTGVVSQSVPAEAGQLVSEAEALGSLTIAPETPAEIAAYCSVGLDNATADNAAILGRLLYELNYTCGQDASTATPNSPLDVALAHNPDTIEGTSLALRETILSKQLITLQIYAVSGSISEPEVFLQTVQYAATLGNTLDGGYIAKAVFIEQFYKPTALESASAELQGKPATLAIGSDTQAYVAQLNQPSQRTTAVFLFHATTPNSNCNLGTVANYLQVPYQAPEGLPECEGCMVHQGFLAAFDSITNVTSPSSNILAEWETLSGVPAAEVTEIYCIGHSLGATLATLCGPWAKSTFPNASNVQVLASGSLRVFNPAAASWWDELIGPTSGYRVVNNKDLVPSLPPRLIPGALGAPLLFEHVGSPIWMHREGSNLPGNYTGYAQDRPALYTGNFTDHLNGYVLGLRQITACNF